MAKENLQTVIISKEIAATRDEATLIARRFANRIYTSRGTKTSWRFRQRPPDDFVKSSFRTFKVPDFEGVTLVYGRLKRGKKDNPTRFTSPLQRMLPVDTGESKDAGISQWHAMMDFQDRIRGAGSKEELAQIAKEVDRVIDSDTIFNMLVRDIGEKARRMGESLGRRTTDANEIYFEKLLKLEGNRSRPLTFDDFKSGRVQTKIYKTMPDPGAVAWLGSVLEWKWDDGISDSFWRNGRQDWMFMWSPALKGVIAMKKKRMKKLPEVSRKDGAAKLFEVFSARKAAATHEMSLPKMKLHKLGSAKHIIYRSDKWNPDECVDYIHEFKAGVVLLCGPTKKNPEIFLCYGGKLTCTERGLVW